MSETSQLLNRTRAEKSCTSKGAGPNHLGGLRRFAVAITVFNVLGHTVFGFEQSWAAPFVALAAAYGTELLLASVEGLLARRRPRFLGGPRSFVEFLLSAHISGLAVGMLLYSQERLWPVAFAAAAAVGSKAVFRAPAPGGTRHFLNPSNFGITLTLLLFPSVSIAPPYHFTEELGGAASWCLPAFILVTGSFLNTRFTRRVPLIAAWLSGFVLQAVVRSALFDTPLAAALAPMTGVAFVLYTFYMVTDPATTPEAPRHQVAFGAAVAAAYGLLMTAHVVFGLFFALSAVCLARGAVLHAAALLPREGPPPEPRTARAAEPVPTLVGGEAK
jgi:hypothetical protein